MPQISDRKNPRNNAVRASLLRTNSRDSSEINESSLRSNHQRSPSKNSLKNKNRSSNANIQNIANKLEEAKRKDSDAEYKALRQILQNNHNSKYTVNRNNPNYGRVSKSLDRSQNDGSKKSMIKNHKYKPTVQKRSHLPEIGSGKTKMRTRPN